MNNRRELVFFCGFPIALATAFLAACSPQPNAGAAAETPSGAPTALASPADLGQPQTACWLLPAATVSRVLGESLAPAADLGAIKYGNTSCNYYAPGSDPDEDAPRLTVTLDWNGYNIIAMQIPKAAPATAAAPYADIGDGAEFKQGVLWVRAGQHSLAMDLRGKGDLHGIAAQLMAAAKPKLVE